MENFDKSIPDKCSLLAEVTYIWPSCAIVKKVAINVSGLYSHKISLNKENYFRHLIDVINFLKVINFAIDVLRSASLKPG